MKNLISLLAFILFSISAISQIKVEDIVHNNYLWEKSVVFDFQLFFTPALKVEKIENPYFSERIKNYEESHFTYPFYFAYRHS